MPTRADVAVVYAFVMRAKPAITVRGFAALVTQHSAVDVTCTRADEAAVGDIMRRVDAAVELAVGRKTIPER